MNEKSSIKSSGFSLIELSVVILIVGLLIYMTLSMGRQQLEIARIKQTRYKLERIQTALALYVKTYGYLPCPARGEAAVNTSAFGVEAKSGTVCSANLEDPIPAAYVGVVPATTLGMNADSIFDGWGNRITYIVSLPCINPDNWVSSSKYKCVDGTFNGAKIQIRGRNGANWSSPVGFMTISHGRSGNGAWSHEGIRQKLNVPSAAPAELFNGNIDSTGNSVDTQNASLIYYDQSINDGDEVGNYFDNIVMWSTPPQIWYLSNH